MIRILEEFWMNYGEIIVLTSAVVTLLGVVFTLFKNNSISMKAVDKTEESRGFLSTEHGKLSSEHGKLSSEHGRLSSEHRELSALQSILLERTADTKMVVGKVQDTLLATNQKLLEDSVERKLQYASLSDAQKKLVSSAEDVGRFAAEFQRIVSENERLANRVERLLAENVELRRQLDRQEEPAQEEPAQEEPVQDKAEEWEP